MDFREGLILTGNSQCKRHVPFPAPPSALLQMPPASLLAGEWAKRPRVDWDWRTQPSLVPYGPWLLKGQASLWER